MEIKFLTDENIQVSIVKALRNKRYSVFDIKEEGLFEISDKDLFQIASSSKRIIITYDKDYVNLAPYFLSSDSGVIVIKYSNKTKKKIFRVVN